MTVMKNKEMEYIQVDEKSLVIYDPDSGDTHFIDEVGQSILNLMEEEVTVDALVETLSQMYISEGDEIRHDVEAFLRELIEKKVVVALSESALPILRSPISVILIVPPAIIALAKILRLLNSPQHR